MTETATLDVIALALERHTQRLTQLSSELGVMAFDLERLRRAMTELSRLGGKDGT